MNANRNTTTAERIFFSLQLLGFMSGLAFWLLTKPVFVGSTNFWIGALLMGIPFLLNAEKLVSAGLIAISKRYQSSLSRILIGVGWACLVLGAYAAIAFCITIASQLS